MINKLNIFFGVLYFSFLAISIFTGSQMIISTFGHTKWEGGGLSMALYYFFWTLIPCTLFLLSIFLHVKLRNKPSVLSHKIFLGLNFIYVTLLLTLMEEIIFSTSYLFRTIFPSPGEYGGVAAFAAVIIYTAGAGFLVYIFGLITYFRTKHIKLA